MSEMPTRIAIALHEDVRAGTSHRWWWPQEWGATNPLNGREYVRADIADEMLAALKFIDKTLSETLGNQPDHTLGPIPGMVRLAIEKAEEKT